MGALCLLLMACGSRSPRKASTDNKAQTPASRPAPRPAARPGPPYGTPRPGPLAWVLVDFKAFVTPTFDGKAAVVLLGKVKKPGQPLAGVVELVPLPTHKNLKAAELELTQGEISRVTLKLRTKVRFDVAVLNRLLGPSTKWAAMVSHFADLGYPREHSLTFKLRSKTHAGTFEIRYMSTMDDSKPPGVHAVVLRRRRIQPRDRPTP